MSIIKSLFVLSIACFIMSCKPDAPDTNARQEANPSSNAQTNAVKAQEPAKTVVSNAGNINIVNDETKSIRPKAVNNKRASSLEGTATAGTTTAPSTPPTKAPMTKRQYTPEEVKRKQIEKDRVDHTAGKTAAERLAETRRKNPKTDNNPLTPSKPGPPIPNSCDLLTEAFIAKVVNVDPGYITVKDGSGKSATQKSCFFRWEHEGTPNSGVLVQIQTNPVPDDFPEWAKYYITAKKTDGDKAPDGSASFIYKDFPGIGQDGAYSFGLGRYYWRTADDYLCMIAFNLESNETQQLAWAKVIAAEVARNFKSKI